MRGEEVKRDIDAVEPLVVGAAILEMVDHLERRAKRVGKRPGRGGLAVDVENVAPDRHCRIAAIVDQVVPAGVAKLGHVKPERLEQVERVARGEARLRERPTQRDADAFIVALPEQRGFEAIEPEKLLFPREIGMVGDVVGGPHEFVKGQNRRAMPRLDQSRRHREILVPVGLSRSEVGGFHHETPERGTAWARPFHMPPRPRAYWTAESIVQAV